MLATRRPPHPNRRVLRSYSVGGRPHSRQVGVVRTRDDTRRRNHVQPEAEEPGGHPRHGSTRVRTVWWPRRPVAIALTSAPVIPTAQLLLALGRSLISSRTPTSRCRSATARRRVRARESPPGAGRAATGIRVVVRSRSLLPAPRHVPP